MFLTASHFSEKVNLTALFVTPKLSTNISIVRILRKLKNTFSVDMSNFGIPYFHECATDSYENYVY